MDKCCTSQPSPRAQRRINGLQLPLHCQQILGWIVFAATGALNFFVLVPIQFNELEIISEIIFGILYISHVTSHLSALLMDPSEKELRKLKVDNVPEFDRRVHAHVIENGRCHLCNIYTSSKKTKHCSICNKCVHQFDHHCKWLNNCIGGRNYGAFVSSVVTALFISSFTTSLCLVDIVYFLAQPHTLSPSAQEYINCSLIVEASYETKYCRRSITFLTFLIIFCASAFAISCALMHLCCFHVYISVLGVSTYEYIVSASTDNSPSQCRREHFCVTNIVSKIPKINTKKMRITKKYSQNTAANGKRTSEDTEQGQNAIKSDLTDLITTIIHTEVDKAKNIFMIDKNRIHPTTGDTTTSSL